MKKNIFNLKLGLCMVAVASCFSFVSSAYALTVSIPTVNFISGFQDPTFSSTFTTDTLEQIPVSVKYIFDIIVPINDPTDPNAEISYQPYEIVNTVITSPSTNTFSNTTPLNLLSDSHFDNNKDNTITVKSCFYDAAQVELGCSKKHSFLYSLIDKSTVTTTRTITSSPGEFRVTTSYNLLDGGSFPSAWFYKVYPSNSTFLSNINFDNLLDINAHIECDNNSFLDQTTVCTDTEDPIVIDGSTSGSFSHILNNAGNFSFSSGDYVIRPCFTTKTALPYGINETSEFLFNDFVCGNTFNLTFQTDNATISYVNPLNIHIAEFKVKSNDKGIVPTVLFNATGGASMTTPFLSSITYELYKCGSIADPESLEFVSTDCINPVEVIVPEENKVDTSKISQVTPSDASFVFKPLHSDSIGLEDGSFYKIRVVAQDSNNTAITHENSGDQAYAEVIFKYQNFISPIVSSQYTFFKEKNPVKIKNTGLLTFTGSLLDFNYDTNYISDAYFEIIEDPGSAYFAVPNFVDPFSTDAESFGIVKKVHKNVMMSSNTASLKTFSSLLSSQDIINLNLEIGKTYYYRLVLEASEEGTSSTPFALNTSNTSPKKYPGNRWFGSDFSKLTTPTLKYFAPEKFEYSPDMTPPTASLSLSEGEKAAYNTQTRTVTLTTSEGLEPTTIDSTDFNITGATITSINTIEDNNGYIRKINIILTLTEETPTSITLSPTSDIADLGGNLLTTTNTTNNLSSIIYTTVKPVLTIRANEISAHNTQEFTVTSSQELSQIPQNSHFTVTPSSPSITNNGSVVCSIVNTVPDFSYACVFTPSPQNTTDSSYTITIAPGAVTSITGNSNNAVAPLDTPLFDITPPSIFAKSLQTLDIPNRSALYTVQFTEAIDPNSISSSDFSFISNDVSQTTLGTIQTITLNNNHTVASILVTLTADGSAVLAFSTNSLITDPSGNAVTQSLSGLPSVVIDITAPIITTASSSLLQNILTTTFTTSEPILGVLSLQSSDFSLETSNRLPQTISINLTSLTIISPTSFSISTNTISGNGSAFIALKNSGTAKITDNIGNILSSTQPSQTAITVDTISPTLISTSFSKGSATVPTSLSLYFSELVTGISASNLILTASGGLTVTGPTSVIPASGYADVFTFYPLLSGSGSLTSELTNLTNITDSFGNSLDTPTTTTTRTDTVDLTAPTVISSSSTYTAQNRAAITFTTSETISNSTNPAHYIFTYSGTTATRGAITYNSTTQTVTIPFTNITGNGTISVSLAASSTIRDASSNKLLLNSPLTLTTDSLSPTISNISLTDGTGTGINKIFTINTTEPINPSTVSLADFVITKTNAASDTPVVTVSNSLITIAINNITGNGSISLALSPSVTITDMSYNPLIYTTSLPGSTIISGFNTIIEEIPLPIIDTTAPFISHITAPIISESTTTGAKIITYTVTFNEPISGFNADDLVVPLTNITAISSNVTKILDSNSYTYTVVVSGEGFFETITTSNVASWIDTSLNIGNTISPGAVMGSNRTLLDTMPPSNPVITTGVIINNQSSFIITFNEDVIDFSASDLLSICTLPTTCSPIAVTKTGTGIYIVTIPVTGNNGTTSVALTTSDTFSVSDMSDNILNTESKSFLRPEPTFSTITVVNPLVSSGGSGGGGGQNTSTQTTTTTTTSQPKPNQGQVLGASIGRSSGSIKLRKKVVKKIIPLYVSASYKPGTLGTKECPSTIKLKVTTKTGKIADTIKKTVKITGNKMTGSSLKLKEGTIYNTQLVVTSCKGTVIPQPLNYSTARGNLAQKKVNK